MVVGCRSASVPFLEIFEFAANKVQSSVGLRIIEKRSD